MFPHGFGMLGVGEREEGLDVVGWVGGVGQMGLREGAGRVGVAVDDEVCVGGGG